MSVTEILSQKITSAEVIEQLLDTQEAEYPPQLSVRFTPLTTNNAEHQPWWLRREYLRMHYKVYPESTEVLEAINHQLPHVAIFVSKEDPNFIAYTPDKASGEGDRQIKTTLGKFLSRYFPHYPDHVIGDIVASHLADMDDTFEIASGAEITRLYLENGADNLGACMSKDMSTYSTKGHHPTEVYDAPGIFMAYLRNKEGKISARSMLYHASETDKRFIRTYLDKKLERKLMRKGYQAGAWHGVEFKSIPLDFDRVNKVRKYVMPYLDGMGKAGSSIVSTVAVIGGKPVSVTEEAGVLLRARFGSNATAVATNTNGAYSFREIDAKAIYSVCPVTGEQINALVDRTLSYYHNGEVVSAKDTEATRAAQYKVRTEAGSNITTVHGPEGLPVFYDSLTGYDIVEHDVQRKWAGYMQLDPRYYTAEECAVWQPASKYQYGGAEFIAVGMWLIKRTDTVEVISVAEDDCSAGIITSVHQQEVGKGWVKVHSRTKGENLYAKPGVVIHRTKNGRKVVKDVHAVRQSEYSGVWDFMRNMTLHTVIGKKVWLLDSEAAHADSFQFKIAAVRDQLQEGLDKGWSLNVAVTTLVKRRISDYIRIKGRYLYDYPKHSSPSWAEIREADPVLCQQSDIGKAIDYVVNCMLAEAEAIDYNLPQITVPAVPVATGVVDRVDTSVPLPPLEGRHFSTLSGESLNLSAAGSGYLGPWTGGTTVTQPGNILTINSIA